MANELILIVEDNEKNLKLARDVLRFHGYRTVEATDGESAIAMSVEHLPALILMDIQLPGMDGLAATAQLKRDVATRSIPVIALTALAMKGDEERIRAAGCDGYIGKPMRYKDLLAAVAAQLES
jgi:two-component system, cell cycle response regulator DivK